MKSYFLFSFLLATTVSKAQVINNTITYDSVKHSVEIAVKKVKPQDLNVSLVKLIATPEKFQGHLIQICGYLKIEFERSAVFLHKEDCDKHIERNGFWLEFSDQLKSQMDPRQLSDKFVIIIGEFDQNHLGHLDQYSGTIKNIIRLTPVD